MNSRYQQAVFAFSANREAQFPAAARVEIAFAGRSNAGKSSALNTLTNQKTLARVSRTPGRTQLINYFALPDAGCFLVDLPGYGYAEVPEQVRAHWQALLGRYLLQREVLRGVVLLMDIRHPMKELDIRMLECCAERQLPAHVLLTKADKLSRSVAEKQLRALRSELLNWHAPFSVQLFSSLKRLGLPELVAQLDAWIEADHAE
ncbi:MAG: YihA family ribosome biogenesis GTP-binding protein [Cardiobacterium sp.]|jgi:ribosome biogenesis GTP-binding protein ysxC|uniref:ribosome biogenesis GTP-binding protein YihA/YsxC n=1 Tax=Cardiobacterium sp. Marseille-Q4385 TaxID=2866573 RepID=UPI000F24C2FA|nr:ribosome biogenesis GTP-binding protein YihA/YsxC [Cardiobacterium sp. Marseille-Q4385]RKW18641.1 MAG: YihA family ribosome biogenesis GTP-binding protein [Cardiobacterium sp.]